MPRDKWFTLSQEERGRIIAAREKKGIKSKNKKNRARGTFRGKRKGGKEKDGDKDNKARKISKVTFAESESDTEENDKSHSNGNAFGGRRSKNKKEESKEGKGEAKLSPLSSTTRTFDIARQREIARVTTGDISESYFGRTELDTHADTCAFGRNFSILSYSGRQCDVTPFLETYDTTKGINIVTAVTAYTDPDGLTYILVFNEGLWFGPRMEHSLINPNQLRQFGVDLCDDPFDSHRTLRLKDPASGLEVPFQMDGTIVYFESHAPTLSELESCPYIELTSSKEWNPQTVQIGQLCVPGYDDENASGNIYGDLLRFAPSC